MNWHGDLPWRSRGPLTAEVLSRALARAGLRAVGSPLVAPDRGWPLGKIPLLLRCSDPLAERGKYRWWSFYFLGSAQVPYVCRSALKTRQAYFLEDLQAVVQPFPGDLQLSGVERAIHKRSALPVLARALEADSESAGSVTARVLSYKPSRRLTVRYRLASPSGRGSTYFAKLLPKGSAPRLLALHEALERKLASRPDAGFSTASVAANLPEWEGMIWRRAAGQSLYDSLSTSDLEHRVRRAAKAVANLHSTRLEWNGRHDRWRELQTLENWTRAVEVSGHPMGNGLQRSLAFLRERLWRPPVADLTLSHRDFYDRQILLQEETCTLLDLELMSYAEPELDLANFVAHLELRSMQGRLRKVEAIAESFLDSYQSRRPPLDASRFQWYLSASLLRLACVYSLRSDSVDLPMSLLSASQQAFRSADSLLRESA